MPFKKGFTPWNKGKKMSKEFIKSMNITGLEKGRGLYGFKKGIPGYWKGKKRPPFNNEWKKKIGIGASGENNYQWRIDRTEIDINKERYRSTEYRKWRTEIFERDEYTCKVNNEDCCAFLEAHHILSWKDHPTLRFNKDNGITLCRVHHPRKRTEEKELSEYFTNLISESNNN